MKVVILCGGQGTRLREETEFRPKPMVEIGGRPILWHIMKIFAHYGLRDFVLCLGYRANVIKDYFLNYEAMNNDFTIELGSRKEVLFHSSHGEHDFRVTLVDTGAHTMTGGRIKRVQHHIQDDTFLLTYGDGLADVNLKRLLEFHQQHGRLATVTTMRPSSRFGVLDLGEQGEVERFTEKPRLDGWASIGFFVLNRGVFDYLEDDECVLEQEPLQRLSCDHQLMAYRNGGAFYAMDTYREYKQLNELWQTGKASWKVWN